MIFFIFILAFVCIFNTVHAKEYCVNADTEDVAFAARKGPEILTEEIALQRAVDSWLTSQRSARLEKQRQWLAQEVQRCTQMNKLNLRFVVEPVTKSITEVLCP